MDCKTALRQIVCEEPGDRASLADHTAQCARCRQMQATIERLREQGKAARDRDLSLRAIRDTRRQAVEILSAAEIRPPAAWALPAWRLGAECAALVLAVGLLVLAGHEYRVPERGGAPGAGEQDRRISRLQRQLGRDMRQFHERHLAEERPASFELRMDELKDRVELCSYRIREELAGCARTP